MALDISWTVIVYVGTHDREQLSKDFRHGPGGGTLGKSAGIDRQPGEEKNNRRIHPTCDEATSNYLCSGGLDAEQHGIADGVDGETEDDERSFPVDSVAGVTQEQHEEKCGAVRYDREQLGIEIAEAKVSDESWQENAE